MMFIFIVYACLLNIAYSQVFDDELSLSLKPPPPPPSSSLQKADFGSVQFLSDIPVATSLPQIQQISPKLLAHRAVLFNSEQESKLPQTLLNPFYKDPRIADVLAKQSWFAAGETHVTDRETEKISRDKIYYALKSAGLVRRRRSIHPRFYLMKF